MNWADRLINAIDLKQNMSVIGLDSDLSGIPGFLKDKYKEECGATFESASRCIYEFNVRIIDAIADIVPAVKIQIAFYEQFGMHGIDAFQKTVSYARSSGLLVIADAKRNDIGNSSRAYSNAFLGRVDLFGKLEESLNVDCLTVNGYLGRDGIQPFLEDVERYGKGIFVLVKTSNPGSGELQDLKSGARQIYEVMAGHVREWGRGFEGSRGYSSVGAVVGATYPDEAKQLRELMPQTLFLVPGYGSQGGSAKDVLPCFNSRGYGAIVNASRSVIFAYRQNGDELNFDSAARNEALSMKNELIGAMRDSGICPW